MDSDGREWIDMGRISKRKTKSPQAEMLPCIMRYKAGIYARLSSDRDARKNESVETQIEIAANFVKEYNMNTKEDKIDIIRCYTDLGKTGSNFNREGFIKLLNDIKNGDINCVIVKDLSRFGRNYLEAGNYIEKIFPFMGVRFISVADDFDTGKEENRNKQMSSEIKNLVNDMYAKDFSQKAALHLKQRRSEGSYVGGVAPYGYRICLAGEKRILTPDADTGRIVIFIFEKFIETKNYTEVVRNLNRFGINPPSVYNRTKEVYHASGDSGFKGWDESTVARIIKSETYVGTLVQGKTSITEVNENAHEPLISRDLFLQAEEISKKLHEKNKSCNHPSKDCPIEKNIFDGILYCGICGRKMTRSSYVKMYRDGSNKRFYGYFCTNSVQKESKICPVSNRIPLDRLKEMLLSLINMELDVFKDSSVSIQKFIDEKIKSLQKDLKKTEGNLSSFYRKETEIYEEYRLGTISKEEYYDLKNRYRHKVHDLHRQEIIRQNAIKPPAGPEFNYDPVQNGIEIFVGKIFIYPGKRMEIEFTFSTDL